MTEYLPQFQIIAIAVNILLVLFIMPLRRSIDELRQSDDKLIERIQALELKIAEKYVQRDEIVAMTAVLDAKLERIEGMLMRQLVSDKTSGNGFGQ